LISNIWLTSFEKELAIMNREIEQRQGMAKFERKVLPDKRFKRV